jgi:hypothetical protein
MSQGKTGQKTVHMRIIQEKQNRFQVPALTLRLAA